MILLIFAIAVCVLFLAVEIPAFIRYHNEEDFILIVLSALMLMSCIVVLFFWRGV